MGTRNRMMERIAEDERLRKERGETLEAPATPRMINTRASRGLLQAPIDAEKKLAEMVKDKYGNGTALPCLSLNPSEIRVGRFFNRLPQSFDEAKNSDFAELLDDVKRTGGNLVSGLVRPYKDESNPKIKYELVFGERRLKACIKAGVEFKAEIAEISDAEFIQLHSTENRFRPQLSIVESALQFKSWVAERKDEAGNNLSVDALAAEIGYSRAHYFRLQAIGNIDESVLLEIPGVESLTSRDTGLLCKVWKKTGGKKLIQSRLKELASSQLKGKAAVEYLCKSSETNETSKSTKVSVKVPATLNNRESLVARLKEIGTEFGIEILVK